jgi:hypothetical protein
MDGKELLDLGDYARAELHFCAQYPVSDQPAIIFENCCPYCGMYLLDGTCPMCNSSSDDAG